MLESFSPTRTSTNKSKPRATETVEMVPPSSPPVRKGLKRQSSFLLPAFDFEVASSPPRPSKRQALSPPEDDRTNLDSGLGTDALHPTPLPSSCGILPSSPPPLPQTRSTRKGLSRSNSTLSELRAPLTSVPSIILPAKGEQLLLGRSSNACHYQLSASRLISRVHVKAAFLPLAPRPQVEIQCVGWNGVKVHCQGHVWSLDKGDKFTSETAGAEIMLDVQDARVVLKWPEHVRQSSTSSSGDVPSSPFRVGRDWNDENANPALRSPCDDALKFLKEQNSKSVAKSFDVSVPFSGARVARTLSRSSPEFSIPDSPTPLRRSFVTNESMTSQATIKVFEDADTTLREPEVTGLPTPDLMDSEDDASGSELSELDAEELEILADEDFAVESQNIDPGLPPIISCRTGFSTTNVPTSPCASTMEATLREVQLSPRAKKSISSHLTNQLAFSRLSSTPLSTLHISLPAAVSERLTPGLVQRLLREIDCIGEVQREGKDAAGKPLECEYYYKPDMDGDEGRKQAVTEGLGRPSLRACRRVHKQYYWKRPNKLP